MLFLRSISLVQFKNYVQQEFRFDGRIVGLCGPNGVGKTNLLDAIYYLCFTKSYFGRTDAQHVHHGDEGFRIGGHFEMKGELLDVTCILRENGRKEFSVNLAPYERLSLHVGRLPCVIIAPDDTAMITEGSEARRRFIDALLSQIDAEYLQRLISYNRILLQRNSCLKSTADNRLRDAALLDVYDAQLVPDGEYIFTKRRSFLAECLPVVRRLYAEISGNTEEVDLRYESQLGRTPFAALLAASRDKDLLLQRTGAGVHKDDLHMLLGGQPFRNIASQGQRKSLLFALKLAEFEMLRMHKGFAPLLLLDDVFEKLDEQRMHNLLDKVCLHNNGQIFITDTHASRVAAHFDKLGAGCELINL